MPMLFAHIVVGREIIYLVYCKVRNIKVEVILATLTSGSDSLILLSVNICSISYSNCISSHNYTWSFDSHKHIHGHTYVQPNLNDAYNPGDSEFFNCNLPLTGEFDKQPRGDTTLACKIPVVLRNYD